MSHRIPFVAFFGILLLITAACTNKKSVNPLANVGSKQPDKVLFDKAMDAMKHNRFDVARITLQTLINTYPDSEFIARAKLAVGDSWYAEGGTASLAQAEQEYRDFITFFPNMPEAAEAQLKIANIQYQQMEKPDRDYTHAKRAEEEYRNLIWQFPDSTLVPAAKQRLLEVQKRLAAQQQHIPGRDKARVAQDQAEDASRRERGTFGRRTGMFMKHRDVAQATKVGDPARVDPRPVSATEVARETVRAARGGSGE